MEDRAPKITALILARGGTKGIPLKNIKLLHGIPLIGYTLKAATSWKCFNAIWVSTDDEKIAQVARQFGSKVHYRSLEVSQDGSPSIDAVQEFLSFHPDVEFVALLQCTSPCLQPAFLEEAYQLICRENCDAVFSVTRKFHLRWSEATEGVNTSALNFDPVHRPRRQDWKGELVECGMFYFTKTELLKRGLFQGGKCKYVEIPEKFALEIDSELDWKIAEAVIQDVGPPDL